MVLAFRCLLLAAECMRTCVGGNRNMFNFIILFVITIIVLFLSHMGFEYRPPLTGWVLCFGLAGLIIVGIQSVIKANLLLFDWKAVVFGVIAYLIICLLKFVICELINKYKEGKRK